jgi:predicted acyl esterase
MRKPSLRLLRFHVVKLPLAAVLLAALVGAQATTPAPEASPVSVQTNVRVKMRDGVSLVADIYRPKAEGKLPVLLTRTPYNRRDPATGMYLASHGYVVILQDTRGRFDS